MPTTATDPTRQRAQRQLALVAASVALLLIAAALVAVHLLHHDTPGAGPAPSTPASPTPTTTPVIWRDVAGVKLPFSAVHGPRVTDHGRAAGYSRDPDGAALAAVHVLTRTSATAGPDVYRPVLAGQVAGANAISMAQSLDERYQQLRHRPGKTVRDGEPIPGNNATVAGYLIAEHDDTAGTALVDVLLTAPDLSPGQVVDFSVSLQWTDGDWRVLAPPNADWGTLARLLDRPPAGALDYRKLA